MVPDDFRILTKDRRHLAGLDILTVPINQISSMWAKWRWQKNNQLGEEKKFMVNPNPDGYCYPSAVYRSLQRFSRLIGKEPRMDPAHTPLSVYWSPQAKVVKLITAYDIETFMRRLAVVVYNLHPVKDADHIKKWSSHSLRVGAVVVLHSMGFSPLDIQWILRWKSTAFMMYLRNVAILSERQNKALNKAAALPRYI